MLAHFAAVIGNKGFHHLPGRLLSFLSEDALAHLAEGVKNEEVLTLLK